MKKNIQLEEGWKNVLQKEFENNYMQNLKRPAVILQYCGNTAVGLQEYCRNTAGIQERSNTAGIVILQ